MQSNLSLPPFSPSTTQRTNTRTTLPPLSATTRAVALAAIWLTAGADSLAADDPADTARFRSKITAPAADFCYQMEWKGYLVNDPKYFTWSHFGLQGPDGKFHLFGERVESETIRKNNAHIAWALVTCAEIAHYKADRPEGPYRFVDVPLKRGEPGQFDPSMIYPTVQRDGNRWVMMYNGIAGWNSWRGGVAVADSLDGPWRKLGMVLEPSNDPKHFTYQAPIHVPALVPFKGKWYAYFHTGPSRSPGGLPKWETDCTAVAVADRPEGPWKIAEQPAFRQPASDKPRASFEEVGAFVWNDRVYLLSNDFFGRATGVVGGVVIFVSEDGLSFPFEKMRLAADLIPAYYRQYDPKRVKFWWEPRMPNRLEAPRIMLVDGRPAYFLAGSGTNVDGGPNTVSYLMKILKWDEQ